MMPLDENRQADLVRRVRRALRLGELTPEQAQAEYDAAEPVELTEAEINRIVSHAVESEPVSEAEPFEVTDWTPDLNTTSVESDVFQLNRNPGDDDAEVDERVEQHRREAFGEGDDGENPEDDPDCKTSG